MDLGILAIYILAVIGMMNILYDTGCWIYDRVVERRCKKEYQKSEEWLSKWGA